MFASGYWVNLSKMVLKNSQNLSKIVFLQVQANWTCQLLMQSLMKMLVPSKSSKFTILNKRIGDQSLTQKHMIKYNL